MIEVPRERRGLAGHVRDDAWREPGDRAADGGGEAAARRIENDQRRGFGAFGGIEEPLGGVARARLDREAGAPPGFGAPLDRRRERVHEEDARAVSCEREANRPGARVRVDDARAVERHASRRERVGDASDEPIALTAVRLREAAGHGGDVDPRAGRGAMSVGQGGGSEDHLGGAAEHARRSSARGGSRRPWRPRGTRARALRRHS